MTFSDAEHRRLPNSLPAVGRVLAEEIITLRRLEVAVEEGPCWPLGRQANPHHQYVRALFAVINAGGTRTAVVVCGRCGHGRRTIGYEALKRHDLTVNDLPLLADYRRDYCERCHALGAQLHHMAPQGLFTDADNWPLAYLCQPCHAEWHNRMRAA